jgi:hypothetical protein
MALSDDEPRPFIMSPISDDSSGATEPSVEAFEQWVSLERAKIVSMTARYRPLENEPGNSVVEFTIAMSDGKDHARRVPLGEGKVEETARNWLKDLEKQAGMTIPLTVSQ